MPCATVHLLTAGRTLAAWRDRPAGAPFDPLEADLVQDFLAGAMAPDAGFVVAVERTMSELVHYVETGTMVRALLRHARTEGEVAFAWGWATHHLTDVLIHPLVGKAVGQVLHGDSERRVNASEDEATHVSVEVGLDIVIQHNNQATPRPASSELRRGHLHFLAHALEETYGLPFDPHRMAGDFRLASRQIEAWPGLIRSLGRAWRITAPGRSPGMRARVLRALGTALPDGSAVLGLTRPQRPPEWLPERVEAIAREFPDRFQPAVDSGGAAVENRNLETGEMENATTDHPKSEHRREWWLRKRSRWVAPRVEGKPVRDRGEGA